MSSSNYIFSENGFKSEDSQDLGNFPQFGGLSGHLKRVIMEGFSPLALIALVDADPSVSDLAKSVMKRKQLEEIRLDSVLEERALKVTLWSEGDMNCVTFPNESDDSAGEREMFRKALTFVLRICSAMNTVNARITIDLERTAVPIDFHLLRLPSMERILTVAHLMSPANAPVDFNTQISTHDANEFHIYYWYGDADEALHKFVQSSLSTPRI